MASARARRREVSYPSCDGKPLAETQYHLFVLIDLIDVLRGWYANRPRTWVGGCQLLYYVEGQPRKRIAPDVMVTHGIPKEPPRHNYQVWREGKAPDVVIELTSRGTRRRDEKVKFQLYREVLKVREYFLFDPRQEYLKPSLKGYRLSRGQYLPIAEVEGRLPSKVLNLHLERADWKLRFYNPVTGAWLPTGAELAQKLEQTRVARELEQRAAREKKPEPAVERRRSVRATWSRPPGQS